ncbi:MAG: hypothetical protein WCI04_03830 [archaeon]
MQVTTIQVEETTVQMLKKVKERTGASSYNEAIVKLIRGQTAESMAGSLARKKHYSREEILKDLRDKFDRI